MRNFGKAGQHNPSMCTSYANRAVQLSVKIPIVDVADASDTENALILGHSGNVKVKVFSQSFHGVKVIDFVKMLSEHQLTTAIFEKLKNFKRETLVVGREAAHTIAFQLLRNKQDIVVSV